MLIQRTYYLNQIISRMNNDMVKVITGIRRCGKSVLLFELFSDYLLSIGVPESNIIKVSLDDDDFEELRDTKKLSAYIKDRLVDSHASYYILLDEAQFAISREEMKDPDRPIRLYSMLNSLLHKRNVDVYITGSNSKFLSADVMTEFRGRGDEIHIAPLSFSEYYEACGKDKYEAWREYSYYGGMPHILQERTEESKIRYLTYLNDEIYLKDICERYDIREGNGMHELMQVIASGIGSLTNAPKIAATFSSNGQKGVSVPTIGAYLSYLQQSFIVEKAERYDVKGRKYISTPCKYYYTDIGLRNALLGFRQYEETHIMENVIYNELLYRGFQVDVGVVEVNSSEEGKHVRKQLEVDFVANKGSRRYYIQSAFAIPDDEKMEQEQASLIRIPDSFKKIIIVSGMGPLWRNEHGVTIMNLFDFLLNPESMDW